MEVFEQVHFKLIFRKLLFYFIDHESFGFDKSFLYFIHYSLKGRKQRAKINSICSVFVEILFGVPLCSISGQAFYFLFSYFFENSDIDIANYADDIIFHENLILLLFPKNAEISFNWFHNNNLISNAEKSNLIANSKDNLEVQVSSFKSQAL